MRNKSEIKAEIIRNRVKVKQIMQTMEKGSLSHYAKNLKQLKELTQRTNELKKELKGE